MRIALAVVALLATTTSLASQQSNPQAPGRAIGAADPRLEGQPEATYAATARHHRQAASAAPARDLRRWNAGRCRCRHVGRGLNVDTLGCGGETQALIYNPKTKKVIGVNALGAAPTG
jgi:gamma-glutamyltranspeptidase/glutathione hydrolase